MYIKQVTEKNFDELYNIYMHPEINPYLSFEIMNKSSFKPIFQELHHSGKHLKYVDKGNTILATAILKYHSRRLSHVVTLTTLAVPENQQGKGYAQLFILKIITELKIEGIKRIDLTVEADNPKAQKLYQKLGFQIEGTLKEYYKRSTQNHYVDEIMMAKDISKP